MYKAFLPLFLTLILFSSSKCSTAQKSPDNSSVDQVLEEQKEETLLDTKQKRDKLKGFESAYFASGCFWCVEAIFESVNGVQEAISGYSGGSAKDANYSDVSNGTTDHAEAVEVIYDPSVVSYETLLEVFFGSHDPTTLNKQGPDAGRQYRSAIFYRNEAEKIAAEKFVNTALASGKFSKITTLIVPLEKFYDAEEYHQDFEQKNPNQGYVKAVSIPRLKKFQKAYPQLLKNSH